VVEQWDVDANAVLDGAGSERDVIIGFSAGAPTAALFAASHPDRTRALILHGGYARFLAGDDYEFGYERDGVESFINHMEANWGTGVGISILAPSRATDPAAREYWARCQTTSASPSAAAAFLRALAEIDVRHALPTIAAPTLILHATRDQNVPVEAARRSQELIPRATLVELDSDIHLIWLSDVIDEVTREIEAFISRTVPPTNVDRALATVLALACASVTRRRDAAIDTIVERFGGRPLRGPGRATFDGPARAIRCALALIAELDTKDQDVAAVAVHSGECELHQHTVRGVAVDLAEQLAATAEPGQVLVSQTIRDLVVGSTIQLEPQGRRAFQGVPGNWDIFAVASPDQ
jgi:hypothetical protein